MKPLPTPASAILASALLVFLSLAASGQPAAPDINFDVASIKPAAPGSRDGGMVRTLAGGQTFTASNVALKFLIVTTYSLRPDQVSGGPAWVNSDGYDVEAKTSHPASPGELMLMLQNLLADRFKLTLRDEKKVQPVYALVSEKPGPNLKQSKNAGGILFYPVGLGHYTGSNVPMSYLAWSLGRIPNVGRVVVDQTGLTGAYDLDLQFTPQTNAPNSPDAIQTDAGPSLFTAIKEQLGLKLESTRAPVDYFTIDHAEHPSEN